MAFLSKIKTFFSRKKWDDFRTQVKKEKQQKYLFRDVGWSSFGVNRGKRRGFFPWSKKSPKPTDLWAFSGFIQKSVPGFAASDKKTEIIMSMIGGFLLLLTLYTIFVSSYFKISPNKVLLEATNAGIDINIAYRSLENVYGKSIFWLDESAIANNLKNNLKNIQSVQIDRLFPNGLKVLVTSASISYDATIDGVPDKIWGLSDNGVLVPSIDTKDAKITGHIQIISDELAHDLFLNYKKVLSDNTISTLRRIFDIFHTDWSDLPIARIRYFATEDEIHITLESNTKIILALQDADTDINNNTPQSLSKNLTNELLSLKTYIDSNRNKLSDGSISYIDARIPGKLFVCADPVQCQKNLVLIYGNTYR